MGIALRHSARGAPCFPRWSDASIVRAPPGAVVLLFWNAWDSGRRRAHRQFLGLAQRGLGRPLSAFEML